MGDTFNQECLTVYFFCHYICVCVCLCPFLLSLPFSAFFVDCLSSVLLIILWSTRTFQLCLPWIHIFWVMSIINLKAIHFSWNLSQTRLNREYFWIVFFWGLWFPPIYHEHFHYWVWSLLGNDFLFMWPVQFYLSVFSSLCVTLSHWCAF